MNVTRRRFGQAALSGLASTAGLLRAGKRIPIAVQLYSVRQVASKDFPGVLAEVARLGYEGVEFAGYYGHSAKDVRKMLDDNGLKATGTHTGLDTLLGDNLSTTLEFNRTIGNKYLIVPGMPQKYRSSIAGWKEAAEIFDRIAAQVTPNGFIVGFHNHFIEFQELEGQIPFDVFFGNAGRDVKVQLDIGHAQRAGVDPAAVINRYKGRVVSVHVKDYAPDNPNATVGQGIVKWKEVFHALETVGGTEWYIVEEEGKACQGFECVARSIKQLREWGK